MYLNLDLEQLLTVAGTYRSQALSTILYLLCNKAHRNDL